MLAATVTVVAAGGAHGQDFDPRGRRKPPAGGHPATPPKPNGGKPTAPGTPKPVAPSAPEGTNGGASSNALVERYTKIVLAQPGSPFPLQRLAQLFRDRDGSIANLVTDFERRAAQPGAEQYAALVGLAGLYKLDGRTGDVLTTLEKAVALKGDDTAALVALARAHQDRADIPAARARYEQALALQTAAADREQTLRTLMGLALDGKDWDGAKRFHTQLAKAQPTSLFLRGELGRELYNRGEYERAEAEFQDLVGAASGDNRVLAPALRDLGRAQAKAHKNPAALATLKRALATAGQDAGVRAEVYETITEIYRAEQRLPALIKEMEAEHPSDFPRLALLGGLYEETGDARAAIGVYRRALAVNPRHIDLRLKLVRLLQSQGELDKAIAEYDGLLRAAPNNPQFVFEQCDALLQRGDRTRALQLLGQLESRAGTDEEVLSRVADFYGRIGEGERALRVLQRLTQVAAGDPGHLVDLGDRYFQDGNTQLANQTWKRILVTVTPRARALAALGDVYLEHDMTSEALAALKEAVQLEPSNLTYKKQLAGAYERNKGYREARVLWQDIFDRAKGSGGPGASQPADKMALREARSRMVTLWGLEHTLEQQVEPLRAKFNGTPPDVEAGRTLAEVFHHLRRLPEAEATLRRVLESAPGDEGSYLALERVLVQAGKVDAAIALLEKLVQVEPKRARELYQRMAQYALQTYRDEDAIKYAARAVELNPDDAEGHRRLGEMYRSRQDTERAIHEYRQAIAKNERLYVVYFELADLLLSKGDTDEADRLFRRVVRGAPDEELVARAARLSLQINLGRGTLESLEQDLLPLAIGNPQKSVYRRLLVDVYASLTFGLVQKVRHGHGKEADEARAALARIGGRAVKPLLDALAASDPAQQRVAIDVLAFIENKNAAVPLFAFATGQGDAQLRARAMVACGALREPSLVPRYGDLLAPKRMDEGALAPNDTVAVAAVWGLARMGDRRALPLLRTVSRTGTPEMRALAVVGLGLLKDRASAATLATTARRLEGGNVARAAAAFALGELGEMEEAPTLLALAQGNETLPRQLALVALARLAGSAKTEPPWGRSAALAMADALFPEGDTSGLRARAASDGTARAGLAGLVTLASGPGGAGSAGSVWSNDPLPVPEGPLEVETTLLRLVPQDLPAAAREAAFLKHAGVVERAAQGALQTSAERARRVLDALEGGPGTFAPFVTSASPPAVQERARELARNLEAALVPLVRHPDTALRARAVVLLSRAGTDAGLDAAVAAAGGDNEAVARMAVAALGTMARGGTMGVKAAARAEEVMVRILTTHESWTMRVVAAEALGQLGQSGVGAGARQALRDTALRDGYALVREASLRALSSFDRAAGRDLALRMSTSDAEPKVREAAAALLR